MAREPSEAAIVAYKTILTQILDNRPSGTRQRLADALGKHRSFVTQITSPSYSTPLPARHVLTFFRVCHFSPLEQERFLKAYQAAHPDRLGDTGGGEGLRHLTLMVPDLGDDKKNRQIDDALRDFMRRLGSILGQSDR